jgi:hypothetical protein
MSEAWFVFHVKMIKKIIEKERKKKEKKCIVLSKIKTVSQSGI